jgi:hypothetical protein
MPHAERGVQRDCPLRIAPRALDLNLPLGAPLARYGRRGAGALLLAHAMIAPLRLIVVPSGSISTGSCSWPLIAFSSGRLPFVKRPNRCPLA